ncbi:MAG: hypothetical protein SF053_02030 [Bacteroidia bacterium]|nr:hypothetical protein [Bacteroidia bacterium]
MSSANFAWKKTIQKTVVHAKHAMVFRKGRKGVALFVSASSAAFPLRTLRGKKTENASSRRARNGFSQRPQRRSAVFLCNLCGIPSANFAWKKTRQKTVVHAKHAMVFRKGRKGITPFFFAISAALSLRTLREKNRKRQFTQSTQWYFAKAAKA